MKMSRLLLVPLVLTISAAAAAKDGNGYAVASASQQAKVEDLAVCYARGTDTLGSAVNAVISNPADPEDPVNIGDPDFDAALALYRACFSKNFSFTLAFDGVPVLTVPTPGSSPTDSALQWANFVNNAFRGPGFRNTQHHMGSISSEINGKTAHMVSYLIATHAYATFSME